MHKFCKKKDNSPSDDFPFCNFPNVQFPKRQLPKDYVILSEAHQAAGGGASAAARTDLGNCHLEKYLKIAS